MKGEGSGQLLWMGGLFVGALLLGLALVWLNVRRVDRAYELKQLATKLEEKEDLAAKLSIERDNLLSPYRLEQLAKEYGLRQARPGQIRRLPEGVEPVQ